MKKRKNKLIDREFQLKTIFSVIGITVISFLVLMAIIGINAANNTKKISSTVEELNEAVALEDSIVHSYIDKSSGDLTTEEKIRSENIRRDHNKSIGVIRKYVVLLDSFAIQNFHLITIIFVIVLVQGILLYYYLLQLTHRISGPIYVISTHIKDIMDGKEPEFRELREKDQFKDLYDQFIKMSERIKQERGEGSED